MTSSSERDLQACRVCGYVQADYFPYGDTGLDPTFDICPVCDVTHGYEDGTPDAARRYRQQWLSNRGPRATPGDDGLTTEQRLEQVPEAYR